MSKRAVGFITVVLWLVAGYFFAACLIIDSDSYTNAEHALSIGLGVVAGGFAIAAFACSCAFLAMAEAAAQDALKDTSSGG